MANTAAVATITGQAEVTDYDTDGTLKPGYRVSFQTAKGVMGTVFVPRVTYSQSAVLAAVKAHAATLDSVQGFEVT